MAEKALKNSKTKTLFIRNLPFTVTNSSLQDVFNAFGPIKSCYVVNNPATGKSRGIGYVKFADVDDAEKALKEVKKIADRRVFISRADKKKADKTKTKSLDTDSEVKVAAVSGLHKVIIRNLPFTASTDTVTSLFSDIGNVSSVDLPHKNHGKSKGFAVVSLATKEAADEAVTSLNGTEFQGRKISISSFLKQSDYNKTKPPQKSPQKKPPETKGGNSQGANSNRLIIRNIPFKLTEATLKKQLEKFGEIQSVNIPTKPDGKKRGFAFVSFGSKESASRVLGELKKLDNRPVAVDWAVHKSEYEVKRELLADVKTEPMDSEAPSTTTNTSQLQPLKTEIKQEIDQSDLSTQIDYSESSVQSDSDEIEEQSNSDQSESKSELESEAESELTGSVNSEPETDSDQSDGEVSSAEEHDSQMVSDSDIPKEEGSDESEDEDDNKLDKKKVKKKHKTSSKDINEERTLFIRNVAYETTEESLQELFSTAFGIVSYVKLLIDPMTERSKGMAFVQFKQKQDADKCIAATQDPLQSDAFRLDGRDLNVALAVSREKITEMQKSKEKQPKDKRNLYLAREGSVRQGTQAAVGVSKTDLNKRMKLETAMRAKLKNPLIFISPVRICIHNLPVSLTDKSLKSICLKASRTESEDKSAKITECRIIRDLTNVNSEGVAKSRGYAFVTFIEHKHALTTLRHLNNNPSIFTDTKRPIVEFSLENMKALQLKEKRLTTSKSLISGNSKNSDGATKREVPSKKLPTALASQSIERPKGVKPGLASHWGPKLRHKARESQLVNPKKLARQERKRKQQQIERREKELNKQPKPKKKKVADTDSFDKLVDTYRSKVSAAVTSRAKSKWYD